MRGETKVSEEKSAPPRLTASTQPFYHKEGVNLQPDVHRTKDKWEWIAVSIPPNHYAGLIVALNSPPTTVVNLSDLFTDYYPNWNRIRSEMSLKFAKPLSRFLPLVEGYSVAVAGRNINELNRRLGELSKLKAKYGKTRIVAHLYSNMNLSRLIWHSLGAEFGYNNIGKVRIGNNRIYIIITCAPDPSAAITLYSIGERIRAIVSFLSNNLGLPAYEITTLSLHKRQER